MPGNGSLQQIEASRPSVAAMAVGVGRAAVEFAAEYAAIRVQFGVLDGGPSAPELSAAPCRTVSVEVRPSLIAIVLRTIDDTAWSCVTTSTVTPSSVLAVCSALKTDAAVSLSSSPVGVR